MADSFMPLWKRTEAVPAMRIDRIEAPTVREPFMWNLVGKVGRGNAIHVERVHADWIGRYMPEVGGYVVSEMDGSLSYWRASMFEASHKPMGEPRAAEVPHDIEPLAGQVWNAPIGAGKGELL